MQFHCSKSDIRHCAVNCSMNGIAVVIAYRCASKLFPTRLLMRCEYVCVMDSWSARMAYSMTCVIGPSRHRHDVTGHTRKSSTGITFVRIF